MKLAIAFLACLLQASLIASASAAELSVPPSAQAPQPQPTVVVIGAYKVGGYREPIALVELWVNNYTGNLDLAQFQQDVPRLGPSRTQVLWLEHELNEQGTSGRELSLEALPVSGRTRLAFFLHYPQYGQSLQTPFGPVALPPPTARPKRLRFMKYYVPD